MSNNPFSELNAQQVTKNIQEKRRLEKLERQRQQEIRQREEEEHQHKIDRLIKDNNYQTYYQNFANDVNSTLHSKNYYKFSWTFKDNETNVVTLTENEMNTKVFTEIEGQLPPSGYEMIWIQKSTLGGGYQIEIRIVATISYNSDDCEHEFFFLRTNYLTKSNYRIGMRYFEQCKFCNLRQEH